MIEVSDKDIYQQLNTQFGFSKFKPGQLEVLRQLLDDKNTLAVLPTGAGKTLIYQMYGFLAKGTVVIVSPLLSLIKDQINRLRLSGERRVAEITSQVRYSDQYQVLKNLHKYKFVFMSPESLQREDVKQALQQIKISLFVVDEAHCVVQWGKSFRPDYLRVGQARKQLGNPLILMLTATASRETRLEIIKYLEVRSYTEYVGSVDRKNIYLDFLEAETRNDKDELLLDILEELPGSGIIYFSSRKVANQVSDMINNNLNLNSAPYHAGMSTIDRFQVQSQFQHNQLNVICATSAFGMGIDKPDIRFVIHYHMPGDVESYVQELGRAGRDGQQSVAIMLYTPGDEAIPSILNSFSVPSTEALVSDQLAENLNDEQKSLIKYYRDYGLTNTELKALFEKQSKQNNFQIGSMLRLIHEKECHRKVLLEYFDEQFDGHQDQCCGSIDHFEKLGIRIDTDTHNVRKPEIEPWKERLNKIFADR
ncbi:RecQ family ATP-dependent DNA helicase [Pediococcus stilesii]|uniref:ATP-dependent DNA helicase RecQ n=1 Tax=Pediococcus stilesii TaxID=331679 RepID=A0A0R2KV44_9LACO|nr:RecQ family ATP-dependent DNA helicase [Pediococcus stilesii]KRN93439.1 ATP-dependent helicase RecQ [Pediococcus stilesii]TLQ04900.1 ATP-dependent DNA helicase RecQ [Pediococcus stilesii]